MEVGQPLYLSTMGKENSKCILITGATGYIGSVVAEELIKEGKRIIALDNLIQGHRESVASEAIFIEGDLGNRSVILMAIKAQTKLQI